jgi:hexosaminidase
MKLSKLSNVLIIKKSKMKYIFILFTTCFFTSAQIKTKDLALMPWPQSISFTNDSFTLNKNFKVNITGNPHPRIFARTSQFLQRLDGRTGLFWNQGFITKTDEFPMAQLQIHCEKSGNIGIHEDESYQLDIQRDKIRIQATSDLGAMHALETLLQLLQNNGTSFYFPTASISDFPRFTWRGLMIDVARHFQPLEVIQRNLDAMAALKMNVFHWHLTDDQGWRIELKNHPKLTQLASDGKYYTQEEIKKIVKYADERGILVVPEIDVPGHASAILSVYPEIGSRLQFTTTTYSLERNSGIFTPTLDPSNPKTYQILGEIFDEFVPCLPENIST